MTIDATYSPEDDKLRLYASQRLDPETYARVKAAGFGWAPKQECFFAVWTPNREDITLELADEIGDESKTLAERATERAERFSGYGNSRKEDAESAHAAVSRIADGIPLGQPILVGHHSERRARKDAERIQNGMSKAVKMWECADYWKQRAESALRHAERKENPDVRSRRIKTLQAEKRKCERSLADSERGLRFWRGETAFKKKTGETFKPTFDESERETIYAILGCSSGISIGIAPGEFSAWSAWDILRPEGERYKACPTMTLAEIRDKSIAAFERPKAHAERWIAHLTRRIEYEQAMLEDSGGLVTDQVKPEVGGAVRSLWAPREGWAFIIKVNRLTISLRFTYNPGGRVFSKTVPFDKLAGIMSKAQVDEFRSQGRIVETACGCGFRVLDESPATPNRSRDVPSNPDLAAMKEALKAGVQVVSATQLFPTPKELAERMANELGSKPGDRVLEPSAGTGRLVDPLFNAEATAASFGSLLMVERNSELAMRLRAQYACAEKVLCEDFLTLGEDSLGRFDRIIMNPPFERGSDEKHIRHAFGLLKPGGRLVALCADRRNPEFIEWIGDNGGSYESLGVPFAETGTNVRVALVII